MLSALERGAAVSHAPSVAHPLASFRLKWNRAKEHAQALERERDAWLARKPYGVFGEYDPGPPEQYIFKVRFFEPIPEHFGVVLGDFAHNARSALDHLAHSLVRANNQPPTLKTQFPIILSPFDWGTRDVRKLMAGMSRRHVEIIESFQPYHRRDAMGQSEIYTTLHDPLAILHRLSNDDKHRVLTTTIAALSSIGFDLFAVNDVAHIDLSRAHASFDPLEDGAKMVDVPIISSGPNPEVQMKREETLQVSVYQETTLVGGTITWVTRIAIDEAVHGVISKLGEIFETFVNEFR
jgi:hypothetical protein